MDLLANIWNWLANNKEWVFGGIGIPVLLFFLERSTGLFRGVWHSLRGKIKEYFLKEAASEVSSPTKEQDLQEKVCAHTPEQRKALTSILFIDDKTDFKVVSILKRNGWKKTKIVKGVSGVDDKNILAADICFVDINGVAVDLFPNDQGLGLVAAIRERHPKKKIVVYSSQREGDRFNELWDSADTKLPKDATPYEFENLVERLSEQIYC